MELEVGAVVPVVEDKVVIEVLETLVGVPVELVTLCEVALVDGEVIPGIVLVELEVVGREVTTEGVPVVLDKTDNDEVMLDEIGVEELKKELAELVGKIAIELLLPKVEKATVDGALDEEVITKLEKPMLWLVTTLVGNDRELDEPMDIEPDETVIGLDSTLVEVISDPDELVMSPGKAVVGGSSEADEAILWLVIRSVEDVSGLEVPAV